MIRHLIWDVDGTLFDTYPAIVGSLQGAALDLGAPATYDETRDLAVISVDHCLTEMADSFGLPLDALAQRFAERYREVSPADQPPFAGVGEVCQLIRRTGWAQPDHHPSPARGTRPPAGGPQVDWSLHGHHQPR